MVENLTRKSNTTVTIKKRIKEGNDAIYSLCVLFASLLLFCCSFGRLLLLFLTGEYPEIWRSFPIVFINTNLCLILSFDGYHLLSLRRRGMSVLLLRFLKKQNAFFILKKKLYVLAGRNAPFQIYEILEIRRQV